MHDSQYIYTSNEDSQKSATLKEWLAISYRYVELVHSYFTESYSNRASWVTVHNALNLPRLIKSMQVRGGRKLVTTGVRASTSRTASFLTTKEMLTFHRPSPPKRERWGIF